jgi:hypothetical protein
MDCLLKSNQGVIFCAFNIKLYKIDFLLSTTVAYLL